MQLAIRYGTGKSLMGTRAAADFAAKMPFMNIGPFTIDQNRADVALGYRPHPHLLLELGYLNQYFTTRVGLTAIGTVGLGFQGTSSRGTRVSTAFARS